MSLSSGSFLGAYEITAKLGEGGMGAVYRARDTKLGRDVALKILPEAFASDPDRLMRFEREARTLASLNHAHIAQVYGVEDASGASPGSAGPGFSRAIVMELVEGEDLSERIARGVVPLDEALPIARQIAEALEAAHDAGIVHRDLKPANIKLRSDGTVKVLDFGLAKSGAQGAQGAQGVQGAGATVTSPAMTMQGMILGTAAYMAPEQARGKPVDKRADIWAFGCVLYEMLTGQRAFQGEDVSDTLASILAREPDLTLLPPGLPPSLRSLIARCLARDPRQRVGSMSTVLYVLTSGLESSDAKPTPAAAPGGSPAIWRRALAVSAVAALAAAAGAFTSATWWSSPTPRTVTRFSFELPAGQIYTNNNRQMIAVSPDGTRIVFVAGLRLHLRSLADPEARPIPGSDIRAGVLNPAFSPDGEWIAFWSGNELKKIPVGGGTPITLYPEASAQAIFGLTWDETGLVFGHPRGVLRVSPDGGEATVLVPGRNGETFYGPQVLPGGRHVLYTVAPGDQFTRDANVARIVVQPLGDPDSEPTTVAQGVDGRYLSTGHLLYRSGDAMMAARFDLQRLSVTGPPVAVAQAAVSSGALPFATHLAVSASGTLVYVAGSGSSDQDLALLDRRGRIARRLGLRGGAYATPRVSPDGRYVAYSERGSDPNIWIASLDGAASPRRLTFTGRNRFPVWSGDGQHLAFESDREGDLAIYWQRADGSGEAERLTTPQAGAAHAPEAFSPDGEHLLLRVSTGGNSSLWWWSRQDRTVHRLEDDVARAGNATFSPDGRWIAYTVRRERGEAVSVVRPFPPTAARYQLPIPEQGANMGIHPVWSRAEPELIYSAGPGLLATVRVDTRSTVEFGTPSIVQIPGTGDVLIRSWDLTPDGQHIVRVIETDLEGTLAPPINVVINWFEELQARVPAR